MCVTGDQLAAVLAGGNQPPVQISAPTLPTISGTSTPPTINIQGDNPAIIQVGDTYSDLGATVTGPAQDINLGISVSVDGGATTTPDQISIDTSTSGTQTISYFATDQNGATGYATRSITVEAATSTP